MTNQGEPLTNQGESMTAFLKDYIYTTRFSLTSSEFFESGKTIELEKFIHDEYDKKFVIQELVEMRKYLIDRVKKNKIGRSQAIDFITNCLQFWSISIDQQEKLCHDIELFFGNVKSDAKELSEEELTILNEISAL